MWNTKCDKINTWACVDWVVNCGLRSFFEESLHGGITCESHVRYGSSRELGLSMEDG